MSLSGIYFGSTIPVMPSPSGLGSLLSSDLGYSDSFGFGLNSLGLGSIWGGSFGTGGGLFGGEPLVGAGRFGDSFSAPVMPPLYDPTAIFGKGLNTYVGGSQGHDEGGYVAPRRRPHGHHSEESKPIHDVEDDTDVDDDEDEEQAVAPAAVPVPAAVPAAVPAPTAAALAAALAPVAAESPVVAAAPVPDPAPLVEEVSAPTFADGNTGGFRVNTDTNHHYIDNDRVNGEANLFSIVGPATKKEAWVYIKGTGKNEQPLERWYEIGEEETTVSTTYKAKLVAAALDDFSAVAESSIYYIGPSSDDDVAGSTLCKSETEAAITLLKELEGKNIGEFDLRVVTPKGTVSLKPKGKSPLAAFQEYLNNPASGVINTAFIPRRTDVAPAAAPAPTPAVAKASTLPERLKMGGTTFVRCDPENISVNTDRKQHYYFEASKEEGERLISEKLAAFPLEEAFIYMEWQDDFDKPQKAWFECGYGETAEKRDKKGKVVDNPQVKFDDRFVINFMDHAGKVNKPPVYAHSHPLSNGEDQKNVLFYPPSIDDLAMTKKATDKFSKYNVTPEFEAIDYCGVYVYNPKPTSGKIEIAGGAFRLSSYEQFLGGGLSIGFKGPEDAVTELNLVGFDASFKYLDSNVQDVVAKYEPLHSVRRKNLTEDDKKQIKELRNLIAALPDKTRGRYAKLLGFMEVQLARLDPVKSEVAGAK